MNLHCGEHVPGRQGILLFLVLGSLILTPACDRGEKQQRYNAEKTLFQARKMRDQVVTIAMKPEFFEETLELYRGIVREHEEDMYEIEGLEYIVVSAQMDLAELEFRTGQFELSRESFLKAADLARGVPDARVTALFSAGFIAEEMEKYESAVSSYERLYNEFLGPGDAIITYRLNKNYLFAPLKIANLYKVAGKKADASQWFDSAEELFTRIVKSAADTAIVREMQFNLLTTNLQAERWTKALEQCKKLQSSQSHSRQDIASLLYIEAKIQQDGFGRMDRALELFERIYTEYPETEQAMSSLLTVGSLAYKDGRHDEAETYFKRIVNDFDDAATEVVEALWLLAQIEEARGKWIEASLQYRSLYTKYPTTLPGLEAPLKIAGHFRDLGEENAAKTAYERALRHYEKLLENQSDRNLVVLLEEYAVRTLSEQGEWKQAAERLLALPDRYPDYDHFKGNYLMAASIYEKELADPEGAARILKQCMERYAGSELAREAERQYNRLTGDG